MTLMAGARVHFEKMQISDVNYIFRVLAVFSASDGPHNLTYKSRDRQKYTQGVRQNARHNHNGRRIRKVSPWTTKSIRGTISVAAFVRPCLVITTSRGNRLDLSLRSMREFENAGMIKGKFGTTSDVSWITLIPSIYCEHLRTTTSWFLGDYV